MNWNVFGVEPTLRRRAEVAARGADLPLGMWLSQTILSTALSADSTQPAPPQHRGYPPHLRRRSGTGVWRSSFFGFLFGLAIIGGAIWGFVYVLEEEEAAISPFHKRGSAHIAINAPDQGGVANPTAAQLVALRAAAAEGDAEAQTRLAVRYLNGDGVTADPSLAAQYLEQASIQGYSEAQYRLAQMYENGHGRKRDSQLAFFWYDSAATRGSIPAAARLGVLYAEGVGTGKDYMRAAYWLRRAADAGDADSQFALGYLYDRGLGVSASPDEARRWWQQAADKGNSRAQARLDGRDVKPPFVTAGSSNVSVAPSSSETADTTMPSSETPSVTDIAEIQRLLRLLAFDPGNTDGKVTQDTTDAISNYQRIAGLKTDGKPSAELLTSLRKITGTHPSP